MQGYTSTKPTHADKIIFADGKELRNIDIMFFDDFVIVAHDTGAPTFYNKRLIDIIEGVNENHPGQRISGGIHPSVW